MKKIIFVLLAFITTSSLYAQDLELKWINSGLSAPIKQHQISPNGKFIAILDNSNYLKLMDVAQKKIIYESVLPYDTQFIDFINDSNELYLTSNNGIYKLDIKSGKITNCPTIINYGTILGKAYSITKDTVIINYYNVNINLGKYPHTDYSWGIHLIDFKNNKDFLFEDTAFTISGYNSNYKINRAVAISPKGDKIAVSNDSGYINFYDFKGMNDIEFSQQGKLYTEKITSGLLFSEDGNKLISTYQSGYIRIWDVATGEIDFNNQQKPLTCTLIGKIFNSNKVFIKYRDSSEMLDYIYLFDFNTKAYESRTNIDWFAYKNYTIDDSIKSISYLPDNYNLMYKSLSDSNSSNLTSNLKIRNISFGDINSNWLFNGYRDSLVFFQSKNDGSIIKNINVNRTPIKYFKVSPDGKKLLVVIGIYFQIWDVEKDSMLCEIKISNYNSYWIKLACCFSANSQSFWVAVDTCYINNFDCYTGKLIKSIPIIKNSKRDIRDLSCNNNNTKIAIGSEFYPDMYHWYWGYDFVDLINDTMTSDRIETIQGDMTSPMFSAFIDTNTFLTSFTEHGGYQLNGQICTWVIDSSKVLTLFKIPNLVNYDMILDRFIIFKKVPILLLYAQNGYLMFYNINKPDPIKIYYTNGNLTNVSVDEDTSELFTMSDNGTVKCYDISNIITAVGVDETYSKYNDITSIIYPNPATEFIALSNVQSNFKLITIYSVFGIKVLEQINDGKKIDVHSLSPGVYFLKAGDKVYKFIKL